MEAFSALLALCAGKSRLTGEFPSQRPVTRSFDVFFDLCLNKRLSKQPWGWRFETPLHPLWRHCNVLMTRQGHQKHTHDPIKYCFFATARAIDPVYVPIHYDVMTWNIFRITVAFFKGKSMDSPYKGTVLHSFDIFDIIPNKPLNKQSSWRIFEIPWPSFDSTVLNILTMDT